MGVQIILASKSPARNMLLTQAGVMFTPIGSGVDEDIIKKKSEDAGLTIKQIAMLLAEAKALEVSKKNPSDYVIGGDQILDFENKGFDKPKTMKEAAKRLALFSGKTHYLRNALCVAKDEKIILRVETTAALTMRHMTATQIQKYITATGPKILSSVGAYQLENLGVQLFDKIEGDYFSILGLPLIELLGFLRSEGLLDF